MDAKAAEKAIIWVRSLASKNNEELPDWGSFANQVKLYLYGPYNAPFKVPPEYQYAYLRVKGLSHNDAEIRMGLPPSRPDDMQEEQKKSWWKIW